MVLLLNNETNAIPSHATDETLTTPVHMQDLNLGTVHLAPLSLCRIHPTYQLINSQKVRSVCSSAPMHHAANCISSNPNTRARMSVIMIYQIVQILVTFLYSFVQQITQKVVFVKMKVLFHKRLISHFSLLFNIQLVHFFSNTYEAARL